MAITSNVLANSQIISQNPILKETDRETYFKFLLKYIRCGKWQERKFVKAQLTFYSKILTGTNKASVRLLNNMKKKTDYYHYIPFDLCAILGYEPKLLKSDRMNKVLEMYYLDFLITVSEKKCIQALIEIVCGDYEKIAIAKKWKVDKRYFSLFLDNIEFVREKSYKVLVTATMSAGKSTFINALTGKNISLSQNMACTSKIHSIIGKLFEDSYSYEYDHELIMDAGNEELLDENTENISNKILVGTYYTGDLGGKRIIINDSPGVNYSGSEKHREITRKLIKSKDYKLLIYLMNATQLGTNDDEEHIEYVKSIVGRIPILFVVNKIDALNNEEECVETILEKQIEYLESKGFAKPIVCPMSSNAGFLSKKSISKELSRIEGRELNNYIDKFMELGLIDYYLKKFPRLIILDEKEEELQLAKTCGLRYIEQIIIKYMIGEN